MDSNPPVINACLRRGSYILAGPSQSGKSTLILEILKKWNMLFNENIENLKIFYFYGQKTDNLTNLQTEFENLKLVSGIPNIFEPYIKQQGTILIFDDCGIEAFKSKAMTDLFVKICHHVGLYVFLLTNNIFSSGGERLNIYRNTHYLFLFKNPLDLSSIYTLGKKILPHCPKVFMEIFQHCTARNHGYLLVDGHPDSNSLIKFRTDIFNRNGQHVYLPV